MYHIYNLERLPDGFVHPGSIYMLDIALNLLSPITIYQKWIFQIIIFRPAEQEQEQKQNKEKQKQVLK